MDLLERDYNKFREHVRVKKKQEKEFKDDQEKEDIRIVQMDFAMSYICEYQDEIQKALWHRNTVMLFTVAVFLNGDCSTYVIVSNAKEKDKNTIVCFLLNLYENYFLKSDQIKEEIIWSDGPSKEFKNQFMVTFLKYLSEKFMKTFSWKYFATSHGKGVCDGVGGNVKYLVRLAVTSKKGQRTVVQNSLDFAKVATSLVDKTQILHISEKEIEQQVDLWKQSKPYPGISKSHIIIARPGVDVEMLPNAKFISSQGINEPQSSTMKKKLEGNQKFITREILFQKKLKIYLNQSLTRTEKSTNF